MNKTVLINLTHLCQVEYFNLNSLERSISNRRCICLVSIFITMRLELPVEDANSADPDQTPRSVASGLGLHCLPMSL